MTGHAAEHEREQAADVGLLLEVEIPAAARDRDVLCQRHDFEPGERELAHLGIAGLVALHVAREHRIESARVVPAGEERQIR
jgi:hypothetical protein